MGNFYPTLGSKSLEELPAIPTNVVTTGGIGAITATWTNNNTLTGCTNVLQLWNTTLGKWEDSVSVASSATTGTITGTTGPAVYNVRVAAKKTSTGRYYPSLVKSVNTLSPYPLTGLYARWNFENTLVDEISSKAITSTGGAFVTGKIGSYAYQQTAYKYLKIDNTSSYIDNLFGNVNNYSISTWIKTATISFDVSSILKLGNGKLEMRFYGSQTSVNSRTGANTNITATFGLLSSNTWYHIGVTFDGTNTRYYKNGQLMTTLAGATTFGTNINEMILLSYDNTENYRLTIDNTYFYTRALSDLEMLTLYNDGAGI